LLAGRIERGHLPDGAGIFPQAGVSLKITHSRPVSGASFFSAGQPSSLAKPATVRAVQIHPVDYRCFIEVLNRRHKKVLPQK
jgi:hypothetical protein